MVGYQYEYDRLVVVSFAFLFVSFVSPSLAFLIVFGAKGRGQVGMREEGEWVNDEGVDDSVVSGALILVYVKCKMGKMEKDARERNRKRV